MGERVIAAIAAASLYAIAGVVTFGHAAAESERRHFSAPCATPDNRLANWSFCAGTPGSNGLGAAIVWPLYWSWEAWS